MMTGMEPVETATNYGWIDLDGERRGAYVERELENGYLQVVIEGIAGASFEIPAADFETDQDAFWWDGHAGDSAETIAVKKTLKQRGTQ